MDRDKLRNDVTANLRACLISVKGKCSLKQVREDYKSIMGTDIPYSQLGCKSLEEFISTIPSILLTKSPNGPLLEARKDSKTSHIANLINKQKDSKKKRSNFSHIPARRPPNHDYSHKRSVVSNWKPKILNQKRNNTSKTPPRQTVMTHNQFVSHPKRNNNNNNLNNNNLPPRFAKSNTNDKENTFQSEETKNNSKGDAVLAAAKRRIVKKMSSPDIDGFCEVETLETYPKNFDLRDKLSNKKLMYRNHTATAGNVESSIDTLNDIKLNSQNFENQIFSSAIAPVYKKYDFIPKKVSSTFTFSGDYVKDLRDFAATNGLDEPVFKVLSRQSKPKKPVSYDCQVKIAELSYTSYPKDFADAKSAEQHAAKMALDDLVREYQRPKSLLLSNEQDVLEKIPPIIKKHYHGVWNWQLEADYKDMFHEELPVNWMEIVDALPHISVVPCLDNKFVLRYCKPEDIFQKGVNNLPMVSMVSVPSSDVKFNEEGTLVADVTCVVSALEVWCRQVDTEEAEEFDKMMEKLEKFYNSSPNVISPKSINVGGFYVALYEPGVWVRVRVLEVDGEDINCFLIDYGDAYSTSKSNIRQLEREFAKEQAQAFLCNLAGLEPLEEASVNSESLQNLSGQRVQIQSVPNIEEGDSASNTGISVIMYDLATGAVINEQLITSITMESASPTLHNDIPTEVFVSYVAENGDIYVQVHSKGYEELESMLNTIEVEFENNKMPASTRIIPTPENSKDKLLLVRNKKANRWSRAKIIDWAPNFKFAQIYFVDIGDTDVISIADDFLYSIEDINDILNRCPEQAVKVRMDFEKLPPDVFEKTPDFVKKVEELLPPDQPVLLKITQKVGNEGVPVVEFFKRSETNNVLFPVNKSLEISVENGGLESQDQTKKKKLDKLISLNQFENTKNVPSSGSLKCPRLPAVGNYFDVKVPCAVNPWNFFVQPYDSYEKLNQLMHALQETYGDMYFSTLSIEDVYPGGIYATRHEDGLWYRTSVIKVIHAGSISVFYCDFGYYGNLTLDQLVPLHSQFLELPYQAIKAKLAGIRPKYDKWTTDDCNYFEKLVCRKNFVSILVSIDKDELYRFDNVVSLKLIDTSTDEDIYIDRDLVEKGIAVDKDCEKF